MRREGAPQNLEEECCWWGDSTQQGPEVGTSLGVPQTERGALWSEVEGGARSAWSHAN